MTGGVENVLLQYGIAGVAIIGLVYAVAKLYAENTRLHERVYALQDARRQDAVDTIDKVAEPLAISGQAMQLIFDKLADSKRGAK